MEYSGYCFKVLENCKNNLKDVFCKFDLTTCHTAEIPIKAGSPEDGDKYWIIASIRGLQKLKTTNTFAH